MFQGSQAARTHLHQGVAPDASHKAEADRAGLAGEAADAAADDTAASEPVGAELRRGWNLETPAGISLLPSLLS